MLKGIVKPFKILTLVIPNLYEFLFVWNILNDVTFIVQKPKKNSFYSMLQ